MSIFTQKVGNLKQFGISCPCLLGLIFLLISAGCVTEMQSVRKQVQPPLETYSLSSEELLYSQQIINAVNARNETVEKDPEWIAGAYTKLRLRKLNDIPSYEYKNLRPYVDNGSIYIIVHPAYYLFFHQNEPMHDKRANYVLGTNFSKRNIVDVFLDEPTEDSTIRVLQEHEKMIRDFLEFKSAENKLVILILPSNYAKSKGYVYKDEMDEYTRYLNEVTNESDSVVYLYSKRPTRGSLSENSMDILVNFLSALDSPSVMVGGSYIGRCLEDFYKDLVSEIDNERVNIIAGLSTISPKDLGGRMAKNLLTPEGRLDINLVARYIKDRSNNNSGQKINVLNSIHLNPNKRSTALKAF